MLHIAISKNLPMEQIAADARADKAPGHVLLDLAAQCPSRLHMPGNGTEKRFGIRSKIFSRPALWGLAERILVAAAPGDVIFATGEDIGIPLAALAGRVRRPPAIAMFVHNLNHPRARWALRIFGGAPRITHWLTNAIPQREFLKRALHVPPGRIHLIPEQTDTAFFTPGPVAGEKPSEGPPLVVAVGLEQRDYHTLAAAVAPLAAQVRISAFSKDAQTLSRALPEKLPPNMARDFYEWPALRELYRAADVIVVPLMPNPYCAGLTAMLEAMACQKPVIITRTDGLADYLAPDLCMPVPPRSPDALRVAIELLLKNRPAADRLARNGREWLLNHHTPAHWLNAMTGILTASPPASIPPAAISRTHLHETSDPGTPAAPADC